MVRGVDNAGAIFIGITRDEVERLLRGERICTNGSRHAPGPHLCLYAGETDADIIARIDTNYPLQGEPPPMDARRPYDTHPSPTGGKP